MTITPLHPYVPGYRPISNITPFTYRDGLTYVDKLEDLTAWLQKVVTFVNENFNGLADGFETEVNRLIEAVDAALAENSSDVSLQLSNQNDLVDSKIVDLEAFVDVTVQNINSALATQTTNNDAAIADVTDYVNLQIASMTQHVNDQVSSIINESVTVNDAVIAGVISEPTSDTRLLLNSLYFSPEVTDAATANVVSTTDSDTRTVLDNLYSEKTTQDTVESGRLSEPLLNLTIGSKISDYDWDGKVTGLVNNPESATTEAIARLYAKVNPLLRARDFYPKVQNFSAGVFSVVKGSYYFDGVQVHVDLRIKISPDATSPMGNSPTFNPPTKMRFSGLRNVLGTGIAHDESGGMWTLSPLQIDGETIGFYFPGTGTLQALQPSIPFPWTGSDIIGVKFSYIPETVDSIVDTHNFTVYGDSITRFSSHNDQPFPTWPNFVGNDTTIFGGGYAKDGATTTMILAESVASNSDVGILMAGINDISNSIPLATTLSNVSAIRTKVATDNFILCACPPYDIGGSAVNAMNAALQTLATNNGWTYVDPFAAYRTGGGTWTAGASTDGTHPTTATQQAAATVIRNTINGLW